MQKTLAMFQMAYAATVIHGAAQLLRKGKSAEALQMLETASAKLEEQERIAQQEPIAHE